LGSTSFGNIRLGERKDAVRYPHPPDATIDEVLILDENSGTDPISIWQDGRYYPSNDGAFTSGKIDLPKEKGVATGTNLTVFLATWTIYPAETFKPIYPYPDGSNIEVQISNGAIMKNYGGSTPQGYAGKTLSVSEPFRYRVFFKTKRDLNIVITDSLIFDDITLYYYGEPKLLNWRHIR
jgi:hypothetical protein